MTRKAPAPMRLSDKLCFSTGIPLNVSLRMMTGAYPTHSHEFYEIEFILEGSGIIQLNGREMVIGKNSFYLLTPADFHSIKQVSIPIRHYNVMFSRAWLSEPIIAGLNGSARPFAGVFNEKAASQVAWLLEQMLLETSGFDEYRQVALHGLMDMMLCGILRALPKLPACGSPQPPEMQRALQYMEYHFRSRLALKELADYVHLSPSYFSQQFKRHVGKSFSGHLRDLRLEYAYNLMRSSTLTVSEACAAAGFASAAHFNRSFRARYGCAPGEARASSSNTI